MQNVPNYRPGVAYTKKTLDRAKKTAYTPMSETTLEAAKGKLAVAKAEIKGHVADGQIDSVE